MPPLLILLIGIIVVIVCIVRLRLGAFFGLMLAAFIVSFLAPGEIGIKVTRVVEALGSTAGKIALIIGCAAVIGKCMMDSGAADRIVSSLLKFFGEKRSPIALLSSGFVLSVPVFFDTVFYLLVPLARSLHKRTKKNYVIYIICISVGAAITHTMVPPTPGPLAMAENLSFDVGIMMIMGIVVGVPCAAVTLMFAMWMQRRMNTPMRAIAGAAEEEIDDAKDIFEDRDLPNLLASLMPVLLPVILISANTIVSVLSKSASADSIIFPIGRFTAITGNPNLALLISATFALLLYVKRCRPTREEMGNSIETALMSAGIIILITAAGGAFGSMLKEAQIGPVIQNLFSGEEATSGITFIFIGWATASMFKISQGSGTVALITTSSILGGMIDPSTLAIHPVYIALAIGSGSLCVSWMNDSGFWIVAKMSGFTEIETLKTWSLGLVVLSVTGLLITLVLATVMPLAG